MREGVPSEHSISSSVFPELCSNCRNKLRRRYTRTFTTILRIFVVTSIVLLCLAVPMGDPSNDCKKNNLTLCCNVTALTTTYYALIKATYAALTTSEVVIYYIFDSLHKAKLSAYSILARIDRKDFCQSTCETDKKVHVYNNAKVRNKDKKMLVRKNDFVWE